MAVAFNAGLGCLTETDKSGFNITVVDTVLDVTVPTEPPPVILTLATLVFAVVGLTVNVTVSGVFGVITEALLQVTTCNAAVQENPPRELPDTNVSPAGSVLFRTVTPVDAVAEVLVTVAV